MDAKPRHFVGACLGHARSAGAVSISSALLSNSVEELQDSVHLAGSVPDFTFLPWPSS